MSRLFTAVTLLAVVGCIVEAPVGDKAKPPADPVHPAEVHSAPQNTPALAFKNGAIFEDKVELLGATVQPGQVIPGEQARVTLFFRVLDTIPEDYTVFIHIEDADGRMERMNADHRPAGGQYPTNQWKKGETVRDEFALYLPPGGAVRMLTVWMGFWDPKTDARMRVKNVDAVRTDGNNRVLLAQVPVLQ